MAIGLLGWSHCTRKKLESWERDSDSLQGSVVGYARITNRGYRHALIPFLLLGSSHYYISNSTVERGERYLVEGTKSFG